MKPLFYAPTEDAWYFGAWAHDDLPDEAFHVTGRIAPLYDGVARTTHWYAGGKVTIDVWRMGSLGVYCHTPPSKWSHDAHVADAIPYTLADSSKSYKYTQSNKESASISAGDLFKTYAYYKAQINKEDR